MLPGVESLLLEREWRAREPPLVGGRPDVDRSDSSAAALAAAERCSCCCCDSDLGGGGRWTGTELKGERSANGSPEALAPGPGCPLSRAGAQTPGPLLEEEDLPRWPPLPSGGVDQGAGEAMLVLPLPVSTGLMLPLDPKPAPALLPSGPASIEEPGVEEAGLGIIPEAEKASEAPA